VSLCHCVTVRHFATAHDACDSAAQLLASSRGQPVHGSVARRCEKVTVRLTVRSLCASLCVSLCVSLRMPHLRPRCQ